MFSWLQSSLSTFWDRLSFLFETIRFTDVLDILIVAFLIYELIILVRHTRAQQLTLGVVTLVVSYLLAFQADLRTLSYVLQAIMNFGIVVLAVVFQPELRRAIEQVGGVNSAFSHFFKSRTVDDELRENWQKAIAAICDAAETMGEQRTGALIVMERRVNLTEIIRTGTLMHSEVNIETLGSIFYEGTPLHDGATVVRDARIEAAGCFLPLSNNLEISKDMGTRHRAALGMSEDSDAIVVVVSEETGIVSLAKNGVMIRRLNRQNLYNLLVTELIPEPEEKPKKAKGRRKAKNEQKK